MPLIARNTLILIVFSLIAVGTASGVARVAKRYTTLEFLGGYSTPVGQFDGIGPFNFDDDAGRRFEIDAANVYDPSAHFGITLGRLFNRKMWLGVGFRYTRPAPVDTFFVDDFNYFYIADPPTFNQYDLDVSFHYLFTDISQQRLAPYIGAGMRAGLTSFGYEGWDSEAEVNLALAVNGGIEVKLLETTAKRTFLTVVSNNSYEYWVSGNRPRYLNLGLALKYYYRL